MHSKQNVIKLTLIIYIERTLQHEPECKADLTFEKSVNITYHTIS
jgi:hypothetical protein